MNLIEPLTYLAVGGVLATAVSVPSGPLEVSVVGVFLGVAALGTRAVRKDSGGIILAALLVTPFMLWSLLAALHLVAAAYVVADLPLLAFCGVTIASLFGKGSDPAP